MPKPDSPSLPGVDPSSPNGAVPPWPGASSANFVARLFQITHDASMIVRLRDRRVVDVNESWCATTGYGREHAVGQPFADVSLIASADDMAHFESLLCGAPGHFRDLPVTFRHATGEERRALVSADVVTVDGEPYAVVIGRDVTAEQQLAETVRVTRESFEQLFRLSPIPSYLWRKRGADLILVDYNEAAVEMTKGAVSQLVGTTEKELFAQEPEIVASLHEALRTRAVVHDCYPYQMKSTGEPKFLDVTTFFVPPDLIVVQTSDDTDEFLLNAAVVDNELRYRLLFDEASDGIAVLDGEQRFRDVNRKACEITGYTREEMLGMASSVLREPNDASPSLMAQLAVGEEVSHDRTIVRRDGTRARIEASARRMADDSVILIFRDVSVRREAEEALRVSEERYRGFVEHAPDIVYEVDRHGRIASLNPAFERLTGFRTEEWIGRPYPELLEEESHADAAHAMRSNLQGGLHGTREYRMRTASGQAILVQANSAVQRRDGEVVRVFGFARDITPQRAAEEEKRTLERRLQQEQRVASLGRIATTVAHEFNNLLMGISSFAELISRRSKNDPTLDRAATYVRQAIRRGKRVTEEVLRFAKPIDPVSVPIDTGAWLEHLRAALEEAIGPTVKLRIDVPSPPVIIRGDPAQLEQVLINLAINARDAMTTGGDIAIAVERQRDDAVILVRDNGHGIPPEVVDSIFDPLFTTKRSGTGLGLSIVHQIVKAHGGAIAVESIVGLGTTFRIVLPVA